MCLHVGVKVANNPARRLLYVDFPGKYVLPFPYEYVLGERDVAAARPRKRNPNKYLCIILNYKVWSLCVSSHTGKMINRAIIICRRDDVKPITAPGIITHCIIMLVPGGWGSSFAANGVENKLE